MDPTAGIHRDDLYDPWHPWNAQFHPVAPWDAEQIIISGMHFDAIRSGRNPRADAALIRALRARQVACAVSPGGKLCAQPTRLAAMQRYN